MSKTTVPPWPENPALFLDLDGTLLEFAPDPASVNVSPRLGEIIAGLPAATGGAVAFISGRTVADLDRLLGAGRFAVAGVHGMERRDATGHLQVMPANTAEMEKMHARLLELAAAYPGTFVEHKRHAIALHYRQAPDAEQDLLDQVESAVSRSRAKLKLLRGNKVLEVKPDVRNKGTAIAAFMHEPPFEGRKPIFIGDDVTDEDGFAVVNQLGGVSVKVDAGPTSARFRLKDREAVVDWLEELVTRRS